MFAYAQDKHSQQNFHTGIPYSISDIENINLTNGNLKFNFDFGSVRGRGSAAQVFGLKYNSKLYETHVMTTLDVNGNDSPQKFFRADQSSGWKYDGGFELRVINRNDGLEQPLQISDSCGKPNYAAVYIWKLIMYFPDGSQHEFRPTGYSDTSQDLFGQLQTGDGYFNVDTTGRSQDLAYGWIAGECPNYQTTLVTGQHQDSKMNYYSTDGTFMRLEIPSGQGSPNPEKWTLFLPDGTKVTQGELDGQSNPFPQRVYDKNGNYVQRSGSGDTGWSDEFGRKVERVPISSTEDHIVRSGVGGEALTWKIRWKYMTVIKKYKTSTATDGPLRCCYSDQVFYSQPKVVDEIELPLQMGGQKFIFNYNGHAGQVAWNGSITDPNSSPGWGDLISISLPSGAVTEYEYATTVPYIAFDVDDLIPMLGKTKQKRLVFDTEYDGVSQQVTDIWDYSISQSGTTTVTGPDGAVSSQYFSRTDIDGDLSGRVYKEVASNGVIVERMWANNKVGGCPQYGCGSMRRLNTYVKTEFMTIPDSAGNPHLTMIKDFLYDKNGNLTGMAEYDWIPYSSMPKHGNGNISGIPNGFAPARISSNVYNNQTEDASNTSANNAASYWNPIAPNVRNAVRSSEIRNGSGTPSSRTEIDYDNPSTTANPTATRVWDSFKGGTYQAYSNPLTSSNSISSAVQYDQYGNPILTTDANGVETVITYGNVSAPNGNVTDLYPTKTEVAANYSTLKRTSAATYDFYTGAVLTTTDVDNGVTSATEYDALGRPLKSIAAKDTPLEIWTRTEYDDLGRRVIVRSDLETKGDGKKVAIQHYDQLGRVRLSRSIENIATEDPYNETHGIKVQTRYQTGNPNSYQLTSNPFRAATASAATNEPEMGWTRSMSVNTGRHAETETFTGASLPAPWGSNTTSTGKVQTDTDANATTVTDQAGKQRRNISNALGQLIRVDEPNAAGQLGTVTSPNQPSHYGYNTLGKMVNVNQGVQNRYFMYDSLGRMLRIRQPEQEVNTGLNTSGNPENNSWSAAFAYDNNGNVLTATDAENTTITNTYDALNRALTTTYSDGTPTVTNHYDGTGLPSVPAYSKGKLTKVTSSVSESSYTEFDLIGRLKQSQQITDGQTYTSAYEYNLSGALIEETYPSGRKVRNDLDTTGQLSKVESKKAGTDIYRPYASNFSYTSAGTISHMKYGNGRWENAKFNSRLQATEFGLGNSATDASVWKTNYEYGEIQTNGTVDAVKNSGNIGKQTLTVPGTNFVQSYTYDSVYRLTEATEKTGNSTNWSQQLDYDRYGNRSSFSQTIGAATVNTTPSVDVNTNRFTNTDFAYDKNGNIVEDIDATSLLPREFIFNGDNKQTEVKRDGITIGRYFYDGEGKRVKKITDTETTVFVYSGGKPIAEYSTKISQSPSTSYLTNDHLGSPRVVTDGLGRVKSRRDFMPFGEEIYVNVGGRTPNLEYGSNEDDVRQKFTGYEKDEETNLDFAEARMYQNLHGRFTAVDPLLASGKSSDPQSFNRYLYVMNNPLMFVDPEGLCSIPSGLKAGQVGICVEAFIAAKRIDGIGHGDGRDFSGTTPGLSARMRVSFILDASDMTKRETERIVSPSSAGVELPQALTSGVGGGAIVEVPLGTLKATGDIVVTAQRLTDEPRSGDFGDTVVGVTLSDGANGFQALGKNLQRDRNGWPARQVAKAIEKRAPPGTIDLNATFLVSGSGDNITVTSPVEARSSRSYPSYAAYAYTKNRDGSVTVTELFRRPETVPADLPKPMSPIP